MTRAKIIQPGATLGVFGSGQLGRMFAAAARRFGYRIHVFSPEANSPTGQLADVECIGDYQDESALAAFCQGIDVATFEFENVPASVSAVAERFVPVRPGGTVLGVCQNRLREKSTLQQAGLPVPAFAAVRSAADLEQAIGNIGLPGILKTASSGYDGKGQVKIHEASAAPAAWESLRADEAIFEAFVEFERELSVIGARGIDGDVAFLGPFENEHVNHILDLSRCPARISDKTRQDALDITRTVLETLDVVGLLCVELFQKADGSLLINELAPRPHNSGHLTIEAFATSQFEQQVRAVTGLPLGATTQWCPAAMTNLLGDLWANGTPRWDSALALPQVSLHLYGKQTPKSGRKMGHLTALANDIETATQTALSARARLIAAE